MPGVLRNVLRVFRQTLTRYGVFRAGMAAILTGYRFAYRQVSTLKARPESGGYVWRALSGMAPDPAHPVVPVFPSEKLDIPAPAFVGHAASAAAARTPALSLNTPAISIHSLAEAVAVGGMDFVLKGRNAVHHDLFEPLAHQCPADLFGVTERRPDPRKVAFHFTKPSLQLETAASLIGQCSANYAHWMVETLPKLAILDEADEPSDTALLIDSELPTNLRASIDLLNSRGRSVVEVERWQPVHLRRLVVVSASGYERYVAGGLHAEEPQPYVNKFSSTALRLLRSRVSEALRNDGQGDGKSQNTRVFLGRRYDGYNLRGVANGEKIEADLQRRGLELLVPEQMTFAAQARACLDARLIVAPVGAALANTLFAPPGCRIVALAPYYAAAHYFFYANLAGTLGHELTFVLGKQIERRGYPMHRKYQIELRDLEMALG